MVIVSMIIQRMLLGRGASTAGMESWDLGYTIAEDASSKAIYVPIWTSHYVNTDKVIIDWGDGSTSVVKGAYSGDDLHDLDPEFVHTYASAGSYRVKIYALPATWSRTEVGQSVSNGYTTNMTTIYNAMPAIRGAYVTYSNSDATGKRMDNLFYGSSALTSIPSDLFSNNTDAETFNSTFHNCSSLSLTNDLLLFAGCSAAKEFRYTFCGVKGGVISTDFLQIVSMPQGSTVALVVLVLARALYGSRMRHLLAMALWRVFSGTLPQSRLWGRLLFLLYPIFWDFLMGVPN